MEFCDIKIYRLIHIKNIPHVIDHGIAHRNSQNRNQNFKPIGDESLIDHRLNREVPVSNGESGFGIFPHITLGDFIPFYFGTKMPMLYMIQKGNNPYVRQTDPKFIIYLKLSLSKVVELTSDFYFSDGHATNALTSFYDHTKIGSISQILDWNAIKADYWGGENLNTKRKKQAELLVARDIPYGLIEGYGCYDEWARAKLIDYGIPKEFISVRTNIYY